MSEIEKIVIEQLKSMTEKVPRNEYPDEVLGYAADCLPHLRDLINNLPCTADRERAQLYLLGITAMRAGADSLERSLVQWIKEHTPHRRTDDPGY
jgi:hypothetical protein